jgi:hypothetical protein
VTVKGLELGIEDTLLYVEGEKYTVNFALVRKGASGTAGLSHIELSERVETVFEGGKSFKLSQTTSFELPLLAEGEYTLVAYIATYDGIRSSEYTAVKFTDVTDFEAKEGALKVVLKKNTENELSLTFSVIREVEITLEEGNRSYADMFGELSREAYPYGFVSEDTVIELLGESGEWTAVSEGEAALPSGTYRLKYYVQNGDDTVEGYVYAAHTYIEPELPEEGAQSESIEEPTRESLEGEMREKSE